MRRLAASAALSFSILFPSSSALAFPARSVDTEQAQGKVGSIVKLKVYPGYGLNLNFIPTGEIIKKAWIDDPSRIALSFDGDLCQWSGNQGQECTSEGATVIHLRQIKPIQFDNLPRNRSGGTLLTVITEGEEGKRNLYQFQVVALGSGEPQYTSMNITPEADQSEPSKPPPVSASASSFQQEEVDNDTSASSEASEQPLTSVSAANDVVMGLMVADQKKEIPHGSKTWRKVQDAIYHLRRGASKKVAASRAGVPLPTLSQLIKWGQQKESGF